MTSHQAYIRITNLTRLQALVDELHTAILPVNQDSPLTVFHNGQPVEAYTITIAQLDDFQQLILARHIAAANSMDTQIQLQQLKTAGAAIPAADCILIHDSTELLEQLMNPDRDLNRRLES